MRRRVFVGVLLIALLAAGLAPVRAQDGGSRPVITPENAHTLTLLSALWERVPESEVVMPSITVMALNPAGTRLALARSDFAVWLWALDGSAEPFPLLLSMSRPPTGLAWLSDDRLAVGDEFGGLWVVDVQTGDKLLTLRDSPSNEPLGDLVGGPGGAWLASSSISGKVELWDVTTGASRGILDDIDLPPLYLTSDPTGTLLAAAIIPYQADAVLFVWDRNSSTRRASGSIFGGITDIAFSPRHLAVSLYVGEILFWDIDQVHGELRAEDAVRCWETDERMLWNITFNPTGSLLAFGDGDVLRIVDMTTCTELFSHTLVSASEGIGGIVWSQDGTLLVTNGWRGNIRVWGVAP